MTESTRSEFLPLYYKHFSPKLKLQAEKELSETTENIEKGLKFLKALIQEDDDLQCDFTDAELLVFLRVKKFNVKKAFAALKNQVSALRKHDVIFKDFEFTPLVKSFCRSELITLLPKRDHEGCAVIFMCPGKLENVKETIAPFIQANQFSFFNLLNYPVTQISGIQIVIDGSGFGFQHVISMPTWVYSVSTDILQKTLAMRIKGIHYVNVGYFGSHFLSMLRLFFSHKLKKRIHVHYDLESLRRSFPPQILPIEFGGEETVEDINKLFDDVNENHETVSTYIKKIRGEL